MGGTNRSFLIDTNAAIALIAKDNVIARMLEYQDDIFVSTITLGELYFGAEKSGRVEANRNQVDSFASERSLLHTNTETARFFGKIKYQLRRKGRPIPDHDVWIAALSLQHNLTLVTRDAHFNEVDDLMRQAW